MEKSSLKEHVVHFDRPGRSFSGSIVTLNLRILKSITSVIAFKVGSRILVGIFLSPISERTYGNIYILTPPTIYEETVTEATIITGKVRRTW